MIYCILSYEKAVWRFPFAMPIKFVWYMGGSACLRYGLYRSGPSVRILGLYFGGWYLFNSERTAKTVSCCAVATGNLIDARSLYDYCEWSDGVYCVKAGTRHHNGILAFCSSGNGTQFDKLYSKYDD